MIITALVLTKMCTLACTVCIFLAPSKHGSTCFHLCCNGDISVWLVCL